MFTYVLYALAGAGLLISFMKDKKKTKMALKKHGNHLKTFCRSF